ncbi:MAG: RHS repeat-associated core domain-containing protein [Porticoccaceae bacterium]
MSGPDFESRISKVAYDSSGRYVISETNPLNQTTSHTYFGDGSAFAGLLQETTDANGLKTRYTYDNFGRVLTSTALYGTANAVTATTSYHWCSGSGTHCPATTDPNGKDYYIKTVGADGSESRVYFDMLGRKVRDATLGFDGTWVFVDYKYNDKGHNTQVSEPYKNGATAYWNTITYDALGRPTQTVDANSRTDTVTYNGLTVTSRVDTTGKNQQKIEVRDELDNLVSVTDNAGKTTTYTYDAYGQMLTLTPPAVSGLTVSPTTITYDEMGRKLSMSDPDKGTWSYTYNMLGELITQKDAKNQVTCMAYDKLGRMVKRADLYTGTVSSAIATASQSTSGCASHNAAHTSHWVYDTASGAGKGQLHQVTGPNSYSQTLVYDSVGRNTQATEQIAGASYVTNSTWDSKNRLDVLTYPGPSNRLAVKHTYNAQGYLDEIRNNASSALYYRATAMDARGNITGETHGNGLTSTRVYQAQTGYLQSVQTGNTPLNNRQNLTFTFDKVGNLTARTDTIKGFAETFSYDSLNRLTGTSADFGNGQLQTTSLTYDALGNILTKTGVGTYQYGSQCGAGNRLHAVCQITAGSVGTKTASYSYDANGSMTSGDGRTITWSAFDKPLAISQSGASATMTYGPERQLLTRSDVNGSDTTTTIYVGGLYEKVTLPSGNTEERHTVGGNTIVTYTNRTAGSAGTLKTRYLHKDHLGSITVITDESGAEAEAFSFDPWGKRRAMSLAQLQSILGSWSTLTSYQKGNLTIPALTLSSVTTHKGFTGHQQLDGVGLIHMGGRVYDAEIGRFLSADPFVDDSTNLQALNRYSYVQNNPLSYTDPSGYFLKKLVEKIANAVGHVFEGFGKLIKTGLQKIGRVFAEVPGLSAAIGAAICGVSGPLAMACMATYGKVMMGLNAAITLANGGTLGQVFEGLAIGAITSGIPGADGLWGSGLTGALGDAMKSHAAAALFMGGAIAKAQGGKFIDGVKGAAIGLGARSVGSAARETYLNSDTTFFSALGDELRIITAVEEPKRTSIYMELVKEGVPMPVGSSAAMAPPVFFRAAPMQSTGGWEAGLLPNSAYQAGARNIVSQERTAIARSVFNVTAGSGVFGGVGRGAYTVWKLMPSQVQQSIVELGAEALAFYYLNRAPSGDGLPKYDPSQRALDEPAKVRMK